MWISIAAAFSIRPSAVVPQGFGFIILPGKLLDLVHEAPTTTYRGDPLKSRKDPFYQKLQAAPPARAKADASAA